MRTRAPAPPRRASATKSRAAAASRGGRREPGARARVRFARRSGATAASSSGPQPRSYVESLNKKERKLAFVAALSDRFQNDAVVLFDTDNFAIAKTADFAKALFGSVKAARSGPNTLIVCARGETHADEIGRVSRNLQRVAMTDDGALDVKDVLRFERIVFTTAAYDAVTQRLAAAKEAADGRP